MLSLTVGHTTCSASFLNQRNKDRKGTFSSVGAEVLSSVVFGYLQSLQGISSFRGHFGRQAVLPAAPQVGFLSGTTSSTPEDPSL